jgi:DNA-binding response OmpR family regulator
MKQMEKKPKKILIVEDEKPLAKALNLKLTKTGVVVTNVYDGEEALAALEKNTFDYILLDLMIPKVDGFQILQELQKRKNATPVVVLSNLGQKEDVKRAQSFGAKSYFIKANTSLVKIVEFIKKEFGQ